jgi:Zn-dependent protease
VPSWLVWTASVVGAILFFASILAHEFGHALAAQAFGIPCRGVTLFALGGVSRIASEPRTAREELVIAGAGPAVSVALAFLFAGLALFCSRGSPVFAALNTYLALVNAGLAIFNLLPALPLDGGRVLRAMIWAWQGDPWRAMRWSATAGRLCGLSFVSLGVVSGLFGGAMWGVWLVLVGLFIERSANGSAKHAREAQREAAHEAFLDALAARMNLQPVSAVLPQEQGGANVDDRMWRVLSERVVQWRARLDTLPRPGEIDGGGLDGDEVDQEVGRRYFEDRTEMYRLLNDVDVSLRSRLEDGRIEAGFERLDDLYSRWQQPAERGDDLFENDPADSLLAGRPERFAPTPEDVLTREPGSSIEV